MERTDIEIFLTLVQTRNFTKTADQLNLSQPTVSHRLKLLEQELHVCLLSRSRGYKQVELSQQGLDFIPIAERMLSVWKEADCLQHGENRHALTIGCTDSVNLTILAPFYAALLGGTPPFDLTIQTHQSAELYALLDHHDVDTAFVFYHLHFKNIQVEQVFQEKLYLVQSSLPSIKAPVVQIEDLDPSKELYLKWNDSYQSWHDRWLPSRSKPHIVTDTILLIDRLWQEGESWMIAPESVIDEFYSRRTLYVSALASPPPDRCCYQITHLSPLSSRQNALTLFSQRLRDYLSTLHYEIHLGELFGPR